MVVSTKLTAVCGRLVQTYFIKIGVRVGFPITKLSPYSDEAEISGRSANACQIRITGNNLLD